MKRGAVAIVLLAACGGESAPPPKTSPLWSDGAHLRDEQGRIALLRGVNARVEGVFDVTFDDGRIPLEPIPVLTAADCTRMRELGLDLLRLPINWSAIEPQPDQFDDAYLDRVADAIDCAGDAGVFVVVDLHQDAYSKEIGEDGAPLWAIVPEPEMLLEGPLDDLRTRRDSPQVQAAFDTFFDTADPAGLQAEYADMLAVVGARFAEHPAVLGFEIYNEPVAGDLEVAALNMRAAAALREAAPDKLVFFEPTSLRNIFDFVPLAEDPFPVTGAVYSPHVYTMILAGDSNDYTREKLEPSVAGTRAEAQAWETPLFIGEYGCGDGTNADLWMGLQAELHDRYLASDAYWLWKEDAPQGAWGLYDHDATTDTWTERPQVVAWMSRIHAARIAGEVVANEYDYTSGALRLEVHGTSGLEHEIYVPERAATTFTVACDGSPLAPGRDSATGLVRVACDGTLDVGME